MSQAPPRAVAPLKLQPREAKPLSARIVLYGVEGWGKTTVGAFAPKPVILMARGEGGYDTLLSSGRVPSVPAIEIDSFPQLLTTLDQLVTGNDRKTVVLDALGGFERLCHEEVCRRDFGNDWSEKGFLSFYKGYNIAVGDWLKLIQRLDALISAGISVVILGHARIKPFKNPTGADYDRYECDCHAKTWAVTARWADAILFGNFRTIVDRVVQSKSSSKGKGIGGADRVVYTERRDAFDAKNRYGSVSEFDISNDYQQAWNDIWTNLIAKESV